jgi:glycosyltransferase involved in cell wall biosynthesis
MELTRKKILFVAQMPPPVHGVSIMNKFIRESKYINAALDCEYINLATAVSIDDLQKNRFFKYFTAMNILLKVFFKMLTRRYDYVYVTVFPYGFSFFKDSFVVLLAKLFRLKCILHVHTYGFKSGSRRSVRMKRFYQFVFKNTEVICLSKLLVEDIEELYCGAVYILPNGIPQENFSNTYDVHKKSTTLLYLSNLIKGKGILVLIDAVALLKERGYKFNLRVVGSENDVKYDTLEKLVRAMNLQEYVTLVGPRYEEEKHNEFRNADIFVLPSDYDTFGLVLLEAMQFGVPCISTNIGGIPDVLGNDRGIIIREITANAIADAVAALIDAPEKRLQISASGFTYFTQNYTLQTFEQRLVNILTGAPDVVELRLVYPEGKVAV